MSCATAARILCLGLFLLGQQMCTANLLDRKHHHKHKEARQDDPSEVDKLVASQAEEQPDPNDPNDFGLMDKATLDAEFPTTDQMSPKAHSGIYDLREGHMMIEDTPEKMDPNYRAQQSLKKVNAMSGLRNGVLGRDDDDENDD